MASELCMNCFSVKGQYDVCKSIIGNADAVKDINDGKCGIKFDKYFSNKFNCDCMSVEWVNIGEPDDVLIY